MAGSDAGYFPGAVDPLATPSDDTLCFPVPTFEDGSLADASDFMDLRYVDRVVDPQQTEQWLRQRDIVWRKYRFLDLSPFSDAESGHLDDGPPPNRDQLGKIPASAGDVPIYLQRIVDVDRRRYRHDLRIWLDTPPDQIRTRLIELRKILLGHSKVLRIALRVRFAAIERDAFVIALST